MHSAETRQLGSQRLFHACELSFQRSVSQTAGRGGTNADEPRRFGMSEGGFQSRDHLRELALKFSIASSRRGGLGARLETLKILQTQEQQIHASRIGREQAGGIEKLLEHLVVGRSEEHTSE